MSDLLKMLEPQYRPIVCHTHGEQQERGILGRWYGCPVCSDEQAKQDAQNKIARDKRENVAAIGLPSLYDHVDFAGWQTTDSRQPRMITRAYDYASELATGQSSNLVLAGPTGTGKTHIAACVVRKAAGLIKSDGKLVKCRYTTGAEIMGDIRASWDAKTRSKHEAEIIASLGNVAVLMIDEVGVADRINGSHDIWSNIIDRRYRQRLPTIITTNLTREELAAHLGDRAFDRIMERCIWANCTWQSYRQRVAAVEEL